MQGLSDKGPLEYGAEGSKGESWSKSGGRIQVLSQEEPTFGRTAGRPVRPGTVTQGTRQERWKAESERW